MSNAPSVCKYHHASDLPQDVWRALSRNETTANIILAFAKKASTLPRGGNSDQLWIALFDDTNDVAFVLSCTKGILGNYPIFIVACKTSTQLAHEAARGKLLADSLTPLVRTLLATVSPQRIFSVFARANVAETFAETVEAHAGARHGIHALKEPYYDATLAVCTCETFVASQDLAFPHRESEDVIVALCRADMSHLGGITAMCKGFSETSPPYVLDDAGAVLEARTMIANRQTWVHLIEKKGQAPEVACLVATTRESDNVIAVTKVFTAEHWRGRGCAARLLHRVCQDIFREGKDKQIVLYVGNSDALAHARRVYRRIGFQGLQQPVPDGERWLEIGFAGTTLGYW